MTASSPIEGSPELTRPSPGVAWIELNRPAKANRIEESDLLWLQATTASLEADPSVRVLVISGRGSTFSAGFNLDQLPRNPAVSGNPFESMVDGIERTRLLTLAVLGGPAIGGAADLALACDMRIACDAARLQIPAARFGLPLYSGALRRAVQRLGLGIALPFVLAARPLEATTLVQQGLISQLVSSKQLNARALALATELAGWPQAPLAAMKRAMLSQGTPISDAACAVLHEAFDCNLIAQRVAEHRTRSKT